MNRIYDCVASVVEFQTLTGKLDHVASRDDLLNQAKLVLEEAKELVFAVENQSEEEILKELTDCLVVNFGFAAMLSRSGYDVYSAWNVTNSNNMSKFCTTQTDGFYTLAGYQSSTQDHYELRQVDRDKWGCFNSANKLMKPISYAKANVSKFTPTYKEEV